NLHLQLYKFLILSYIVISSSLLSYNKILLVHKAKLFVISFLDVINKDSRQENNNKNLIDTSLDSKESLNNDTALLNFTLFFSVKRKLFKSKPVLLFLLTFSLSKLLSKPSLEGKSLAFIKCPINLLFVSKIV